MATVKYFIRTSKATDPKKAINVRIQFTHGRGGRIYATTGLEVLPNHFSNTTQRIKSNVTYMGKHEDNTYLSDLEAFILHEFKKLKEAHTSDWLSITIDKFRFPDKYKEKKVTLYDFIQTFIDEAPNRTTQTGKTASPRTLQDYKKAFENIKEFGKKKGKQHDFKDIDKDFYTGFVAYLTNTKKYAKNTVGKKIKVLKIFLNAAAPKHINTGQFKDFTTLTEEAQNVYLTIDELSKIAAIDYTENPRLDKVRDLFLIGCWTGLRYSDWHKVKAENIDNGMLKIMQTKTGQPVVIPILPELQRILNKYDGTPPPTLSNQKFNDYLKEVTKDAELNQIVSFQRTKGGKLETISMSKANAISSHSGRRSFATNMYKMNIPIMSIMAVTGHRKESSFLRYLKLNNDEHAERMKDVWLNAGNHLKIAK
jgi:integrase